MNIWRSFLQFEFSFWKDSEEIELKTRKVFQYFEKPQLDKKTVGREISVGVIFLAHFSYMEPKSLFPYSVF